MKKFIADFLSRGGGWVFTSNVIIKLSNVIISIIIVRLISMHIYGYITFSMSIVNMLMAFGGLGANWSLLRFGSLLNSYTDKYNLFIYSTKNGGLYTIGIIFIIILFSFFLTDNLKNAQVYLIILSFSILSTFYIENIRSFFRIIKKNKIYSKINIFESVILLLFSLTLTYLCGGVGYVIALVISPLPIFLYFFRKISLKTNRNVNEISTGQKKFIIYGLNTGIGSIASQAVFLLGPIIAGYLGTTAENLAAFKVATIIPYSLMFIPLTIMLTDFVHFAENSTNHLLLKTYYWEYVKTILLISFIPFTILLLGGDYIINILFGEKYSSAAPMMIILNIGLFFSFIFRIPLGNILSAVGKAGWNVVNSIGSLILFIPLSTLAYCQWGILGISISISIILILSGFISGFLLIYYINSIKKQKK